LQYCPRAQGALRGNAAISAAGEARSKKRLFGICRSGTPPKK
jgi:hypothetical protein